MEPSRKDRMGFVVPVARLHGSSGNEGAIIKRFEPNVKGKRVRELFRREYAFTARPSADWNEWTNSTLATLSRTPLSRESLFLSAMEAVLDSHGRLVRCECGDLLVRRRTDKNPVHLRSKKTLCG